jgi:protein-tyrosine phosphatase
VIDIHCHILPEVDDGAKSWEIAKEMCQIAAEDGITDMVATPHANDRYRYDRESLQATLRRLQELIGASPRLALGCDFHLSYDNLQAVYANPERYVIEKTQYLLVELSNYSVPAQITDCFHKLGDKGVTPVLTHPERNPILQSNPQRVLEWAEQGCVVQVTASAVTGGWGERVQQIARWLLEHEAVHVLATDAHDTKHRVPRLSAARDAVAESIGADVAEALVASNPKAILSGQPLPYFPKPVLKS